MKKNILANVISRIWGMFSNFLFIPIYIHLLGFNSYSVISYTLFIAGLLVILDAGLTATLLREFSRQDHDRSQKIKVYESLQLIYFGITISAILAICIFSTPIASSLKVQGYTIDQLSFFLKVFSFDLSFQLMFRFYLGGVMGIDKQIPANVIQVLWGVFRSALVLPIIYFFPSLDNFFIWQSIATVLFTIIVKYYLDSKIYDSNGIRFGLSFDKNSFAAVKGFAGGMFVHYIISTINSHTDRFMISKILDLENLGYYTLAVTLSTIVIAVVNPIQSAILPKITELNSLNKKDEIRKMFNEYSTLISIVVFSVLANILFFDRDLLEIWTKDPILASKSSQFLPYVATAYSFLVLQNMCFLIAVANGYTRLNIILGLINMVVIIPGYYFAINEWGVIGVSIIFMITQLIGLLVYIYFMNRKFIGEKIIQTIFYKQLVLPAVFTISISYLFYLISHSIHLNHFFLLILIGTSIVISFLFAWFILVTKDAKQDLALTWNRLVSKIRK